MVLLFSLLACSTMGGKFTQTTRANMNVFADNTLSMLNEANFGFTKGNDLYTREFFYEEGPEEKALVESAKTAEQILETMLKYSLKLVAIVEANPTESDRVQAYANYLDKIIDQILSGLDMNSSHYEDLAIKIGEQEDLLDALRTAQPVIYAIGRYMHQSLDLIEERLDIVLAALDQRIETEYASLIRYQEILEAEKYEVLAAMELVYLTSKGDMVAYERLKTNKHIISQKVIPDGTPNEDDIVNMAEYLQERLSNLLRVGNEIEPDWSFYRATHLELDDLYKTAQYEIRQIRLMTLVWIRAHQKMASGIVSPAEWFDISDVPALLLKMGTKSVGL